MTRDEFEAVRAEINRLTAALEDANRRTLEAAEEIERLQTAIAWTREVRPGKDPVNGSAIVHMTWDQFNTMRAIARAALEPKP